MDSRVAPDLGRGNILFITGTDTGVGKTVLTALLTRHLRNQGLNAMAMKPFCSGSRADVRLLREAQEKVLTLDEINPFFFDKPVAPGAMSGAGKNVRIDTVLARICHLSARCDVLLIEGSGGLKVPLSENYMVSDLIAALGCPVLVVAKNRLGTINHTVLTVEALQNIGVEHIGIALIEARKPDFSSKTNAQMIRKWTKKVPIFGVPFLNFGASLATGIENNVKIMKKVLARFAKHDNFVIVLRGNPQKRLFNKTR